MLNMSSCIIGYWRKPIGAFQRKKIHIYSIVTKKSKAQDKM